MTDWHILLIVSHFRLEKRTKNSTTTKKKKKRRKVVIKVSLAFLSLILIRGIFRLYYGDLMVFWPWKIVSRKIFSSLCSSNKAAHLAILWYYAQRNLPEKHQNLLFFFKIRKPQVLFFLFKCFYYRNMKNLKVFFL